MSSSRRDLREAADVGEEHRRAVAGAAEAQRLRIAHQVAHDVRREVAREGLFDRSGAGDVRGVGLFEFAARRAVGDGDRYARAAVEIELYHAYFERQRDIAAGVAALHLGAQFVRSRVEERLEHLDQVGDRAVEGGRVLADDVRCG